MSPLKSWILEQGLIPDPTNAVPAVLAKAILVILPFIAGACTIPSDVEFSGRQALEPQPEFFVWYWMTEACSGHSGDARHVRWFLATGIVAGGERAVGNWRPPHDITILTGFQSNGFVVRHEILHDLLNGDPLHEDPAWDTCRLRREVG